MFMVRKYFLNAIFSIKPYQMSITSIIASFCVIENKRLTLLLLGSCSGLIFKLRSMKLTRICKSLKIGIWNVSVMCLLRLCCLVFIFITLFKPIVRRRNYNAFLDL